MNKTRTKVLLTLSNTWEDIIEENEKFIMAMAPDGVITYVMKNGEERVG